jgi:hypothetical protein
MKRVVWCELGSYISKHETQHYIEFLGLISLKGAWRSSVPWLTLHTDIDRLQLSRLELQISIDPLAILE